MNEISSAGAFQPLKSKYPGSYSSREDPPVHHPADRVEKKSMALAGSDDLLKAAAKELLKTPPAEQVLTLYKDNETGSFESPLHTSGGDLLVGGTDGNLYAIDGKLQKRVVYGGTSIVATTPVEGKDGTFYFGTSGTGDNCIYAVSPKGELLWGFPAGGSVESRPLIGDDGTVYAGSADNNLYALYPNGAEKWRYETGGAIYTDPVFDSRGNILVASLDKSVYSINQEGKRNWRFKAKDGIRTTVALDRQDNAYFGDWAGNFFCVDRKGKERWKFQAGGIIRTSPVLGKDGAVYFGSFPNPMAGGKGINGTIYSLEHDGSLRWKADIGEPVSASPALRSDGSVYCGGIFGALKALNPDGTVRWQKNLGEEIKSISLQGANEDICVTTMKGIFIFCDKNPVARVEDIVLDAESAENEQGPGVEIEGEWIIIDGMKLKRNEDKPEEKKERKQAG